MNKGNSIFFHEDDYCQLQLLPMQSLLADLQEDDTQLYIQSESYTSFGFDELYKNEYLKEQSIHMNIAITDFEFNLKDRAIFYFEQVLTGYGSYQEIKVNTRALGFENYVLYYSFYGNAIDKLWICFQSFNNNESPQSSRLINALKVLGESFDLILVDWQEEVTVNLKNEIAIVNYFEKTDH